MQGLLGAKSLSEFKDELGQRFSFLKKIQNTPDHNIFGFRSAEINTDVDVCYYGCSFTYGEGESVDNRWTNLVDSSKHFTSNNFGICGLGTDEILSVFAATSQFIKMKKAVFLLPAPYRLTIPDDFAPGSYINLFPKRLILDRNRKFFRLPDSYYLDRAKSSINLISYIAKLQGIEIYFSSWDEEVFELLPEKKTDYCYNKHDPTTKREDGHPNIAGHIEIAKLFTNIISADPAP